MSGAEFRLQAVGLTLRMGGRTLFDRLELCLRPGECRGVRGPSGTGKTLLLRQIAGLDPYCGETLTLDGRTPEQMSLPAWRAEVAYVPQRPPPVEGTAADLFAELASLKSHRRRRLDAPVEIARGWGLEPDRWQQPWEQLSGGERHRVMLALAVARRPAVLLLDEPTASLDPGSAAAVEDSLRGWTILWVTHDVAQAARLGGEPVVLGEPS